MTVGEAVARHYLAHGLPMDGGESARSFRVRIGPITVPLPNPPARRRAVYFHDVNHVLTGYDTTFSRGEMAIAGFEVGAGCGGYLIAWFINLSLFAVALVVAPRTVFRAFVRGRRSSNLYRWTDGRDALAAMSVPALRSRLRIDNGHPDANGRDRLAFVAWSAAAVVVFLLPIIALTLATGALVALFRRDRPHL
jgi:hypothetical protein